VLFPYLTGDLNSHPEGMPSRWIIDFDDRSESESQLFSIPFARALTRVKPQREKGAEGMREAPWWLFERPRPSMRKAIAKLDEVLVMTKHSVTLMPCRVSTENLFGNALVVFATDSFAHQAMLASSPHQIWAIREGSGIRKDPPLHSVQCLRDLSASDTIRSAG